MKALFLALFLVLPSRLASCWALEDPVTLAPGFTLRVAHEGEPLAAPSAMDIDPLTGELYIDNTLGDNGNGRPGHILGLNLATGQSHVLIRVSNGYTLGFAPDGTLYFGVANFLLGRWDRQHNTLRKFAIIPGVRGIVSRQDFLIVGEGSYGPRGLFPDSILRVSPRDGYFEPIYTSADAALDTGNRYNALSSVGLDGGGNLYAVYKGGQSVRKSSNGSHFEVNSRHDLLGGLNEYPSYSFGGAVFQYDIAGGFVFVHYQQKLYLLAFGEALRGTTNALAGITTDGVKLYLCGDYNRVYEISAGGRNLLDVLTEVSARADLSGVLRDEVSGEPLGDAILDLANGITTTTAGDGSYSFSMLPTRLYEMTVTKAGYLPTYQAIDLSSSSQQDLVAGTGLPRHLAPGLQAEVWAGPQDGLVGLGDVVMDSEGNLYSLNLNAAQILKHVRDPQTGALDHSFEFASGDGLAGAWSAAIDKEGVLYTSNGNDGVIALPPLPGEQSQLLTADPEEPAILRNQFGQVMTIDKTRDADGFAVLDDGTLIISSGSGGEPSPPCNPEGTKDTLLHIRDGGCATIFSRGQMNCAPDTPNLLFNPDMLRLDHQGRVLVTNKGGNVVRINGQNGCVDWFLPGDGNGVEAHRLGSYSAISVDPLGNLFIRGARFDPADNVIRHVTEDGRFYTVVSGMGLDFSGIVYPDPLGRSLIYADGKVLIHVFSTDGRPIAEVVREKVPAE